MCSENSLSDSSKISSKVSDLPEIMVSDPKFSCNCLMVLGVLIILRDDSIPLV